MAKTRKSRVMQKSGQVRRRGLATSPRLPSALARRKSTPQAFVMPLREDVTRYSSLKASTALKVATTPRLRPRAKQVKPKFISVAQTRAEMVPHRKTTCDMRKERQEVLFAKGFGGRPGPQRPHRPQSKVRC